MKKALSIVLAIILTFSLAASAYAVSAEGNILTVGTEGADYTTLSAAISAAADGDTIKLVTDFTTPTSTTNVGKSLTFDFNGHKVTCPGSRFLSLDANKNITVTVKNGEFVNSAARSEIAFAVRATNDLILEDLTIAGTSTGAYGIVTILSPNASDPCNVTVKNCTISCNNFLFSDQKTANLAWNLYIYNSDLSTSEKSVICKVDKNKAYDAVIYSGHVSNATLDTTYYPNLTIAEGSYMTATENGSKDTAITEFTQEFWVYTNETEPTEPSEKDGTTTDALTVSGKASIRLGAVSGIRFYTAFDESKIDGEVVEKGTLIGPKDLIGTYLTDADVTADNAVMIPYKADTLWENNEFVGSIVGIKDTNYNREFTARAYVKLSDGTYLYSGATVTKTVADIADAYIADANSDYNTGALNETLKNLVDAWASANN